MDSDTVQNPFIEALHSDALSELLQDEEKRELAETVKNNLIKLSDMFVKLSDSEKHQFVKEFQGQFLDQLKVLSEAVRQQKIAKENGDNQDPIPVFGAANAFLENINLFLTLAAGLLILLLVVFFGYKLYLSLTEKERKREEKMKAKQAKKKK